MIFEIAASAHMHEHTPAAHVKLASVKYVKVKQNKNNPIKS